MKSLLLYIKSNILEIILFICAFVVAFILGVQTIKQKVYDKECFSNIIQERDFLIRSNNLKWELIMYYEEALNTESEEEKQYCISKIDSIYNLEQ